MTFRELWQTRSLRFWIAAGMMIALGPVVIAAVLGFIILNNGAIAAFQDVADRQAREIIPAQHIGLMLWDTALNVDEFVEDGNATRQAAFRSGRTDIESGFAALLDRLADQPVPQALLMNAYGSWSDAAKLGEELISVLAPSTDPQRVQAVDRFDGAVRSASDSIYAAIQHLEDDIEQDQLAANLAYERALWLAGIGAGVCLLAITVGVIVIGRVMVASVDRLVDGALRFAEGDRTHRIDVRVPPELRRVANEFNRMIGKIDAYEDVLSERALKDVLTGLPNRRAFEEAIAAHWERSRLSGEPFALLQIDVDHFKRINDTYGHAIGDEVLRGVAGTFSKQLRSTHTVFRTGGEEFVALIPQADISEALVAAERLRAAISAEPFAIADKKINVTISIGAADSRGSGNQSAMVSAADAALYEAKMQGRNRIVAAGKGQGPQAETPPVG